MRPIGGAGVVECGGGSLLGWLYDNALRTVWTEGCTHL